MTRLLTITLLAVAITIVGPSWSYNSPVAESYATLFARVEGAGADKALHLLQPDACLNKVKTNDPLVVPDARTPAKIVVFTSILSDSLPVPIQALFTKANLDRIPRDKTVVVLCKSGARETVAGTDLRHTGFENVFILKGGYIALAKHAGSKEANTPPSAAPVK